MNSSLLLFLSVLLVVVCVRAHPSGGSHHRCKCLNGFMKEGRLRPQDIPKLPYRVLPASSYCPTQEIIVIIGGKEKCVKPESKLGKLILKKHKGASARPARSSGIRSTTSQIQSGISRKPTSAPRIQSSTSRIQSRTSRA